MLQPLGPTLLTVGTILTLAQVLGRNSPTGRAIGALICAVCALRYLGWRLLVSMPHGQSPLQQAWAWLFVGCETAALLSSMFAYMFMSRRIDRHGQADRAEASPLNAAPVDVFIATYNEGEAILERTIVGALAIEHDDLRVWVLDDGARDWVRDLCADFGMHYVHRFKGRHAKAGNINNALRHALNTGRRPEFVLLLDADFVANRRILRRTLGLFEDATVGIVQTPQHFFNPDPVQANLLATRTWPDEQRFFFNELLPCKDAWGAAFCCGTSAVIRVAALEQCGGMAVETVTEDMLTSFKMEEYGWRTIFLNEMLSLGLAPEGISQYISQRGRWCLGAMQQIYTRWSFAGPARLRLISRLSCLDGVMYWSFTFPFKILMISAPLVYWWTGTSVMTSTLGDLAYWLAPSAVAGITFLGIYSSGRILPVITDAMQLLPAFVIIRTVATALVRPFGRAFKVTAKGLSTDRTTVQWGLLLPFATLAMATAMGMLVNLPTYSVLHGASAYQVNIFWSLFNIAVLLITISACVELPRPRNEERFATAEPATIETETGIRTCTVINISVSGARLHLPGGWQDLGRQGTIALDGGTLRVAFVHAASSAAEATVQFIADPAARRRLIAKLFTGDYSNEVAVVRPGALAAAVLRKLLG